MRQIGDAGGSGGVPGRVGVVPGGFSGGLSDQSLSFC